jgi:hypothetical protein
MEDETHKGRPYAFQQLTLMSEQDYHKKHPRQAYMFVPIVGTVPFHPSLTSVQSKARF